ncbi:MAG: 2'-5' RNA ligase family protein [Actinomyces sp.]|nr:2'-5' RNA ligase family protein [Actinomyces sp.]MDN6428777.1 2'-5' RNA ligase family protein [Propionibacterium sp.]MDN6565550.1 2'-5' RNA ligase family protein [Actinomyces sp.]MDN6795207.1 2'-5' RNA ligase family protein [Propionibacterium sp.]
MFLPPRSPGQDWLGVVIAIPEPWVTQLTELRLGLGDLQGSLVPAHVTLLPPIPVPARQRTEVIRHLRSVAQRHLPFRITIRGADTFRPASQVAFLRVDEGDDQCRMLADDIRTGPLDQALRYPYHPHVTLAQDVEDPAMDLALDVAADFSASWVVPGFRLDRLDPSGMYSSMALFDFEVS